MGTVMPRITHDKVAELKEAFFILDSSGSATVSGSDIKALFSSCISGPLEKVFSDALKECNVDGEGPLTFAQFYLMLTKLSSTSALTRDEAEDNLRVADLCAAFAPFDPDDTGMVDSKIFFLLLGEKGNKLSPQEQESLRLRLERTGHMTNGWVHYKAFIGNLVATNINTPYF
ncbi:hypothetical protein LSCM1_04656 [Leishmania martiniquensis]|uniref:Calmodulin-like protein n=1 Tax=Leishmania martiniquensis TaxID=1580590 RepID=A0A836HK28_9TRYP|nr:hypothetical protein LSCM1_04656 [Leishmania martiniquensis]